MAKIFGLAKKPSSKPDSDAVVVEFEDGAGVVGGGEGLGDVGVFVALEDDDLEGVDVVVDEGV